MSVSEQRLRHAIESGEILTVMYAGGSQPWAKREIRAVGMHGAVLKAYCLAAGAPRNFRLDRLSIVAFDHPAPEYVRKDLRAGPFDAIAADVANELGPLSLGIVVSERAMTAHRFGADGRMQGPVVVGVGKRAGRGRNPWQVARPDGSRAKYATMGQAVDAFRAAARTPARSLVRGIEMAPIIRREVRRRGFWGKLWRFLFMAWNLIFALDALMLGARVSRILEGLHGIAWGVGSRVATEALVRHGMLWASGAVLLGLLAHITRGDLLIVEEPAPTQAIQRRGGPSWWLIGVLWGLALVLAAVAAVLWLAAGGLPSTPAR